MNNKIGKFIAELRKEKGMTQKELGEKLYISDKAVSKWERGLSIPDLAILEKLASVLNVEISDILMGKKGKHKEIDIEEEINKATSELKRKQIKRIIVIIFIFILLSIIMIFIIFKNVYLGYEEEKVKYVNSSGMSDVIKLGIPKFSFDEKSMENSYTFKNIRNKKVLEKELNDYFKTLKYVSCNDSIYYYNEEEDFTIVNYDVINHYLFSTISVQLYNGDYCKMLKYKQDDIFKNNILYSNNYYNLDGVKDNFQVWFAIFKQDTEADNIKYEVGLRVVKLVNNKATDIEASEGYIELIGNKAIYTRTKIYDEYSLKGLNIPKVSTFTILEDKGLLMNDAYLNDYEKEITLYPPTEEDMQKMRENLLNEKTVNNE